VLATRGRNSSVVAIASRRQSSARGSGVDPCLEVRGGGRDREAFELALLEEAPAQPAGERVLAEGVDPCGAGKRVGEAGSTVAFGDIAVLSTEARKVRA